MKRDDIHNAARIDKEIDDLEAQVATWAGTKSITVSHTNGFHKIALQDYEAPSEIGRAFRAVQAACLQLVTAQLADAKARLEKIGVTVQ